LFDDHDNYLGSSTTEAIYVRELVVVDRIGDTPSEGLDLQGINLYYETLIGDIDDLNWFNSVGNGSVQQVTEPVIPEPSTSLLVLCGLGLLRFRRGRK
jgi:hypothetical protein